MTLQMSVLSSKNKEWKTSMFLQVDLVLLPDYEHTVGTVVRWLSPQSKGVLCLRGFPLGALISSHGPKTDYMLTGDLWLSGN